jgi:integrase/recombinase XerD
VLVAHLDRWMSTEGVELDGLSAPVIERYLAERRSAGYVEYRSVKALRPLLEFLAPLGVLPVPQVVPPGPGGGIARPLPRLPDR